MTIETLLAFMAVAGIAVISPGPAIMLALRNAVSHGLTAVVWSSLGNISGLFCLSAATMLGLGVLLKSSALLFATVKIVGALYLFYIGFRHLLAPGAGLGASCAASPVVDLPKGRRLYGEAFLMAITNPKAILFFTALFPHFVIAEAPLLPQFFILTGLFMTMSFTTLFSYAVLAVRAQRILVQPSLAKWVNRLAGAVFISFGTALLVLRRPLG